MLIRSASFSPPGGALQLMMEKDIDQSNALHAAIENENVETVKCLLDWWNKESTNASNFPGNLKQC